MIGMMYAFGRLLPKKRFSLPMTMVGAGVAWMLWPSVEGFNQEWLPVFHGGEYGSYPTTKSTTKQSKYTGYPIGAPPASHPYYGIEGESNMRHGDETLTNLYRRIHNLDNIQRTEVFQFNDALAGGSYGIPREPWVGEAYDRAMMDMKQQIREDIAAKRIPHDEAYDVPTKPLMGTFAQCHLGDCQWEADAQGHILGIPSQVGTRHAYY